MSDNKFNATTETYHRKCGDGFTRTQVMVNTPTTSFDIVDPDGNPIARLNMVKSTLSKGDDYIIDIIPFSATPDMKQLTFGPGWRDTAEVRDDANISCTVISHHPDNPAEGLD